MYSYIPKLKYCVNPDFTRLETLFLCNNQIIGQKLLYLYNNQNESIDWLSWGEFKVICACTNRKDIIKYWIGKSAYKYRNGVCYA